MADPERMIDGVLHHRIDGEWVAFSPAALSISLVTERACRAGWREEARQLQLLITRINLMSGERPNE